MMTHTLIHLNYLSIRESLKAKRFETTGAKTCAKYHSARAKAFAKAALEIMVVESEAALAA
jgi:hypothetical protein